ncbi:MAG: PorP/SprF family type IX secretion system membrane protein [Bacteroidia bacterium]|nr:PorP/SprF family type IX secretion system membrane protein [Bacteroidia bacterium]
MKKLYLIILGVCTLGMAIKQAKGQDALYSQYYSNWLGSNPAMTGNHGGVTVQSLLRDQWRNVQFNRSRFTTGSINVSWLAACLRSGVGFYYNYNAEGEGNLTTTNYGLSYAYVATLTPDYSNYYSDLRFGISIGEGIRRINWDNLVFVGQLDPFFGIIRPQNLPPEIINSGFLRYIDMSSGIAYQIYNNANSTGLRLGIAAHHLNKPEASLLGNSPILPWRWTAHGSLVFEEFGGYPRLSIVPGFKVDWQKSATVPGLFETNPDAFTYRSINAGVLLSNTPQVGDANSNGIYGGIWYHNRNPFPDGQNTSSLIGMFGVIFKREGVNYNVGLSTDYYFQGAGSNSGVAAEISLTVNWPYAGSNICPAPGKRSCVPNKSKYPLPVNF